jgi:Zn-finger nucleic acid-binding protein
MLRRWFSRKREVEIDECPACGGHWLDAGELAKIRREIRESGGHQTTRLHIHRLVYQYASQIQTGE